MVGGISWDVRDEAGLCTEVDALGDAIVDIIVALMTVLSIGAAVGEVGVPSGSPI